MPSEPKNNMCMPPFPVRIAIAGGGTGGHLFPGIAIAQEIMTRKSKNRVLFISTGKPFELAVLAETGFDHASITSEGIKGREWKNQAKAIVKIPLGIIESAGILRGFKPHLVLGVGGYSSGPVAVAAWLLGIKIALHEQNIIPGLANRLLVYLASRIYVSFENTQAKLRSRNIRITGNPIRKEILQLIKAPNASAPDQTGDPQENRRLADLRPQKPFTVLVIGGSQGAHRINMAVKEALHHFRANITFFFVHQTGAKDEDEIKAAYGDVGIPSEVKSFFHDMAQQYQRADLVICRAGATTVAEVTAIGKGVIFIPYPFAADDHQALNARTLADVGAAEMILQKDLTGKLLAEKMEHYASHPAALSLMASRAKQFGRPHAAAAIVDDIYNLMAA
ncbi:undecaprenyldiphospho-muramoylpentapeptide beta-N-acetylglucosaminyltransferase [Thermodesulfobacteriota bacterium]